MATEETGIAFTVSRASFIFNHKVLSDMKVVVPVSNNGSESKVISAHKFVLAISSPLSSASFMVKWRRLKTLLNLPNCEYESLLEFFSLHLQRHCRWSEIKWKQYDASSLPGEKIDTFAG